MQDALPWHRDVIAEQDVNSVVALTIERRKKEDEKAQRGSPNEETNVMICNPAEFLLNPVHGLREIKRNQATDYTQQNNVRDALQKKFIFKRETKHRLHAGGDVGYRCSRHTGYQQGKQGRHGEVEHQHLEREDHPRNGSLEDACHSSCCATAHQQHHAALVEPEQAAQIGTNCRARQHDRSLCSHRTAKADGNGAGHKRRPHVVPTYLGLTTRNGIEDARHAVADVVTDNAPDKHAGKEDANDGKNQV